MHSGLTFLFGLCVATLVYSQCDSGTLEGFPYPDQVVYIDPLATCTFAEYVLVDGDCSSYVDVATLIGPIGGAVNSYTGTGTLVGTTSTTIFYDSPNLATSLSPGVYSLIDQVTFGGGGGVTQTFVADFTITNSPIIVSTDSTSTIVTSNTVYVTVTDTATTTDTSTSTPAAKTVTAHITVTKTAKATTTTVKTTTTPKAYTKTVYKTITVTDTKSCLSFWFPPKPTFHPRNPHQPHKFEARGLTDKFQKRDEVEIVERNENDLKKRTTTPGDPCPIQGQPTATLYTNTVLTTTTVDFTSTDDVTVTDTVSTTITLKKATITVGTITDKVTVTPTKTATSTIVAKRPTKTTTDTITITSWKKASRITQCPQQK